MNKYMKRSVRVAGACWGHCCWVTPALDEPNAGFRVRDRGKLFLFLPVCTSGGVGVL